MDAGNCPSCGRSKVVEGEISPRGAVPGSVWPLNFALYCIDGEASNGVGLTDGRFRCCIDCGHLWSKLDPLTLLAYIKEHAEELTRDLMGLDGEAGVAELDRTPELTRASTKIREIDWMIRTGELGRAAYRFREITRCDWDRAIEVAGRWHDLTFRKKLDVIGWQPEPRDERQGLVDHPMHDPEIDG